MRFRIGVAVMLLARNEPAEAESKLRESLAVAQ
jgi:hypothetical protein